MISLRVFKTVKLKKTQIYLEFKRLVILVKKILQKIQIVRKTRILCL